jgi:predicted cation transporter
MVLIGLLVIAALALLLPLLVHGVEEQMEIFLAGMGILAVTISSQWSIHLLLDALREPIKITAAVLAAGVLFRFLYWPLARAVDGMRKRAALPILVFLTVVILAIASSVITAIIAALVLVEVVTHLGITGKNRVRLVVMACSAIGFGAALTPFGEPLATVAIANLSGEPYHAGFWFLARTLWMYIVPAVLVLGALAALSARGGGPRPETPEREGPESFTAIAIRTAKVYVFVAGLVLLGHGFRPLIDAYIVRLPVTALYWINASSAFLDNATLAAAEIVPTMTPRQITAALLGLLAAGGMLIPGNVPNIIAAGKLKIRNSQWAVLGLPLGIALMALLFAAIMLGAGGVPAG